MSQDLNEQTMPITFAVYGKHPGSSKEYEPRGGTSPVWRVLSDESLDALAAVYPKARRFQIRRAQ